VLSDSTNIDVARATPDRNAVLPRARRIGAKHPRGSWIRCLRANIQRLILLGEIAQRTGRKLCLSGAASKINVPSAARSGACRWPTDLGGVGGSGSQCAALELARACRVARRQNATHPRQSPLSSASIRSSR